jgi:very-short-patch-repair endonuclease
MLRKPKHLTQFAKANRRAGNPAEMALWDAVKGQRAVGLPWRKQHSIDGHIVDLCCIRARVAVEIDGGSHDDKVQYDAEREAKILEQGFEVVHYGHSQVLANASGIGEYLETYCRERALLLF